MIFRPRISTIADIADLKRVHKHRVPKLFYEYVDEGSYTESTYRRNYQAFESILFRQRVGLDISNRNLSTTILGQKSVMPLAISPVGGLGLQHADGEILVAKAAQEFGVPFALSTMSICSIEDIAENTTNPFWFQLYISKDKPFAFNLVDRARAAGCTALIITVDLPVVGQRHKDVRNEINPEPRKNLKNTLDYATHPGWAFEMLGTKRRTFRNVMGHATGVNDIASFANWTYNCKDESIKFEDFVEYKERFGGKLILKGLHEVEDVVRAINYGADAIIISNHGGRQLDGSPATIEVLPRIAEAVQAINRDYVKAKTVSEDVAVLENTEVDSRTVLTVNTAPKPTPKFKDLYPELEITRELDQPIEVYLDGGIYTGQNILRAKALGADAVMAGRAIAHGLGAYGQEGVSKALDILYKELDATLALCGRTDINTVDESILQPNTYPTSDLFKLKTDKN